MTTKPLDKDALRVREAEVAREATRHALAEVVDGAGFDDADALIDHLDDLGFRVTAIEGRR